MAESESVIETDLDINKLEANVTDIAVGLKEIRTMLKTLNTTVGKGFDTNLRSLQKIEVSAEKLDATTKISTEKILRVVESFANDAITEITNVVSALEEIMTVVEGSTAEKGVGVVADLTTIFKDAISIFSKIERPSQGSTGNAGTIKNMSQEGTGKSGTAAKNVIALPGEVAPSHGKENANSNTSANGIVSGLAADMGALFSYDVEGLLQSLEQVKNKVAECATKWGQELAAKVASKAEDIAIIALYAADYVKAFAGMVAQLAASAAAWVKETAAKVANTAAAWAQVAATTAWQAICVAATAVTTAFGAAMSFLASPIGLVVVAIAAVIAIVALLIANWDTVSAKAKEVWDLVKVKFEEFNDFLQNVFAVDWTQYFGAFGNVLNAFL